MNIKGFEQTPKLKTATVFELGFLSLNIMMPQVNDVASSRLQVQLLEH